MELKDVKQLNRLNSTISSRYGFIDIAKAIGIILVILGHMNISGSLYNYLFSFHMPLFVLLSGMVYDENKVVKNIKQLLIPYVSATTILTIIVCIKSKTLSPVRQYMFALIGGGAAPYYRFDLAPAVWFITCLIIIEILSWVTNKYLKNIKWCICALTVVIGYYLSNFKSGSWCPWNIDVAMFLFPIFEIGHSFPELKKNINELPNRIHPVLLLLCAIVLLFLEIPLSRLNGEINIYRCTYGRSVFLYYILAFLGSTAIIIMSTVLSRLKMHRILDFVGQNTLVPMCIHQPLLTLTPIIMGYLPYRDATWYRVCAIAFELVIVLSVSLFVSVLIRNYCPILLGKKIKKSKEALS